MAQTAVRNHTCVPKQQLFVTVVKLKKENGWQNYKQYDIENDLNSALQDWKPKVFWIAFSFLHEKDKDIFFFTL